MACDTRKSGPEHKRFLLIFFPPLTRQACTATCGHRGSADTCLAEIYFLSFLKSSPAYMMLRSAGWAISILDDDSK